MIIYFPSLSSINFGDLKFIFLAFLTLLDFLLLFLVFLLFFQGKTIEEDAVEASISSKKMIGALLVVGGFFLWLGSEVLIKGAVSLAQDLGVSERIISISIVSVGTSIPELTASVIAIVNKEKALSLGNQELSEM